MGNVENKLRVEDSSIHDWYRFVLSFPPHLVQQYLETFCVDQTSFVLDPFCGTGRYGFNSERCLAIPPKYCFTTEAYSFSKPDVFPSSKRRSSISLLNLFIDPIFDMY